MHEHVGVRSQKFHEGRLVRSIKDSRNSPVSQRFAENMDRLFVIPCELRSDVGERGLLEYQPAFRPCRGAFDIGHGHAPWRMMLSNNRLLTTFELDGPRGRLRRVCWLPGCRAHAVCYPHSPLEYRHDGARVVRVDVEFGAYGDDFRRAGQDTEGAIWIAGDLEYGFPCE